MSYDGADIFQSIWALRGILDPTEYIISVDQRSIWRRHLAWANQNGGELRSHLIQRYSANMTFMALVLSAELMVLFTPTNSEIRHHMHNFDYDTAKFWIGLLLVKSVFLTLFTLVATFTAWGVVSSISDANAVVILRSSIGQYAAQLPSRLLVSSLYSFLLCIVLWVFELLPKVVAIALTFIMATLFLHIISVYSSLGRLIIHTGAMGPKPVLDPKFEKMLLPSALTSNLILKAVGFSSKRIHATVRYRESLHPVIKGAKSKKPSRVVRPGYAVESSSRSSLISSEIETIHSATYASFGSTLDPSEGTGDAEGDLGGLRDRPSNLLTEDSSRSNETEEKKQHGQDTNIRQRTRRRRKRASRVEWEHESLARHLYGAPPAPDEEDEEDREFQHDECVLRASHMNQASAGSRPRHLWWASTGDANDAGSKHSVAEEAGAGEHATLLGKICESTGCTQPTQARKVQRFEVQKDDD